MVLDKFDRKNQVSYELFDKAFQENKIGHLLELTRSRGLTHPKENTENLKGISNIFKLASRKKRLTNYGLCFLFECKTLRVSGFT